MLKPEVDLRADVVYIPLFCAPGQHVGIMRIIDGIIEEPEGGAHQDYAGMAENIKNKLRSALEELSQYEIEHLLSINCWLKIKEKDFVEPREFSDLNKAVERILTRDKTVDMVLDDKIDDYNILNTIVTFNPHKDKKEKIYRYIESCKEEEQIEYLSGLKKTVELLERNMG